MNTKIDLHTQNASKLFGVDSSEVTKETICDIMNQLFRTARHMI